MKKRKRNILLTIVMVAFISFGILLYLLPNILKSKIQRSLNNSIPKNMSLIYNDLDVSVLKNSITINNVIINFRDTKHNFHTDIMISTVLIEGISIWNYWLRDEIEIDNLIIEDPKILHKPGLKRSNHNRDSFKDHSNSPITIKKVDIRNGKLTVLQDDENKEKFAIEEIDIVLSNTKIDENTLAAKIPFNFNLSYLDVKTCYVFINSFDLLKIQNISFSDQVLITTNVSLKTIYSPQQLSEKITTERDHLNVEITEIKLCNPKLYYDADRFSFVVDTFKVLNPKARFFRDKLITDDLAPKKLYGKLLKELPIDLSIAQFTVHNGYASYKEKIDSSVAPEEIYFDAIEVTIPRLSNRINSMEVFISSSIMGEAPMNLEWVLPIKNDNEYFQIKGMVKDFDASSLNPFLRSNARSAARGFIDEMYFTTSGNQKEAKGDMKMKYKNFEFVVLKKDRLGVNKLLTEIGNLFVSSGSDMDDYGYRFGEINTERDPAKSFFNYLWLQVRDGIISTVTGNGRKD